MTEYWKGCPFCGRYGYNLHVKVMEDTEGKAWAECWDCHAQGPKIRRAEGMTSDNLITVCQGAWNARIRDDSAIKRLNISGHLRKEEKDRKRRRYADGPAKKDY